MKLRITVEGVSYDVDVEVLDQGEGSGMITAPPAVAPPVSAAPRGPAPARPSRASSGAAGGASGGGEKTVKSPIAGTITQVRVKAGDAIGLNQVLLVMEAMKMETNIASPVVGKVKAVKVAAGEAVKQGQVLVEFD
jgi:glutaconyl-CoA/methylmalonyl-CoA decarboxylase subunit gamma